MGRSASIWKQWGMLFVLLPTAIVVAIRFIGWLQPLEWFVYDSYFQFRHQEARDDRVLVVGIKEQDVAKFGKGGASLSDKFLLKLLEKIQSQRPSAIGLDLYRDIPIDSNYGKLVEFYKNTPNLIGIEKVIGDEFSPKISPPPVLKQLNQVSSVDTVVDGDGVLRRGILYPVSDGKSSQTSLGLAVALLYLKEQGITPIADESGFLKLGKAVFQRFEENDGGYIRADTGGYQILLNYRGSANSFRTVTVSEVLGNKVPPDWIRDRIVLIGTVASSSNDKFFTPYSRNLGTTPIRTYGVEIHANIASQIISTTLNERPLIKVLDEQTENLWIIFCGTSVVVLGWKWKQVSSIKNFTRIFFVRLVIFVSLMTGFICVVSFLAFSLVAWWIPVVPCLLALWTSSISITSYSYITKLQESTGNLEKLNAELVEANENLELNKEDLKIQSSNLLETNSALLRSEERKSLALEASNTGIWELNFLKNEITISENCSQLFDLETDSFTWTIKAFTELVYPEDASSFIRALETSIKSRKGCNISFRIPTGNNVIHWLQIKAKIQNYNEQEPIKLLGTITDITRYKLAEELHSKEHKKNQTITRNIIDIIFIINSEGVIGYSNPSSQKKLGYALNDLDLMGKNLLDFVHPNDLTYIQEYLEKICQDPTFNSPIEYRYRHGENTWRFIRSVGVNQLDNPVIKGIILYSLDITEYKQIETALLQYKLSNIKLKEDFDLVLGLLLKYIA